MPTSLYLDPRQCMEVSSQIHTPVRFVCGEKVTGIKWVTDRRNVRISAVSRGAQIRDARSPWRLTFCTMSPKICGSSSWNLLYVTVQAPRILKWPQDFWKFCTSLAVSLIAKVHSGGSVGRFGRDVGPTHNAYVCIKETLGRTLKQATVN
jgi:hypothetical protein